MSFAVSLLYLTHLVGLALGMGSATVKTVLLFRCSKDPSFVPTFLKVSLPLTRLLVTGLILLVVSGAAWMFVAHIPFTSRLIVKLALVAALFVLGPVIDNFVAPRHERLAPEAGASASPEFLQAERQFLAIETFATFLFYGITALWVFR